MDQYYFYQEYNGRTSSSQSLNKVFDELTADSFDRAIKKFCKRHKVTLETYETLDDGNVRVYVQLKKFLKPALQQIYYVTNSSETQ